MWTMAKEAGLLFLFTCLSITKIQLYAVTEKSNSLRWKHVFPLMVKIIIIKSNIWTQYWNTFWILSKLVKGLQNILSKYSTTIKSIFVWLINILLKLIIFPGQTVQRLRRCPLHQKFKNRSSIHNWKKKKKSSHKYISLRIYSEVRGMAIYPSVYTYTCIYKYIFSNG